MLTRRTFVVTAVALAVASTAGLAYARRGHGRGPKQVVVNGVARDVAEPAFTIHRNGGGRNGSDVAITTDANTQYLKSDGTAGAFADVVQDARVQAKGARVEDGSILAKRVLIKLPEND
jgi:hypothetical protein